MTITPSYQVRPVLEAFSVEVNYILAAVFRFQQMFYSGKSLDNSTMTEYFLILLFSAFDVLHIRFDPVVFVSVIIERIWTNFNFIFYSSSNYQPL